MTLALKNHATMPIRQLGDYDKDKEDQKRQAYYSGGIGEHGGGRCGSWAPQARAAVVGVGAKDAFA